MDNDVVQSVLLEQLAYIKISTDTGGDHAAATAAFTLVSLKELLLSVGKLLNAPGVKLPKTYKDTTLSAMISEQGFSGDKRRVLRLTFTQNARTTRSALRF